MTTDPEAYTIGCRITQRWAAIAVGLPVTQQPPHRFLRQSQDRLQRAVFLFRLAVYPLSLLAFRRSIAILPP